MINETIAVELLSAPDVEVLSTEYPDVVWDKTTVLSTLLGDKYFPKSRMSKLFNEDDFAQAETIHQTMSTRLRIDTDFTLSYAHIHLGPTNSGKTFDALAALAQAGQGVYAGPLRMLAREAYDKLVMLVGEDKVGLITGEEKINPNAPIIAATAEAAPMSGELLVLDETHWLSDPQRGWAWTRLLLAGQFNHMQIIADRQAEHLIRSLIIDAQAVEVSYHERLTPLTFEGKIALKDLPPKTAVVTFSRKGVLALESYFKTNGRPAAVLYGALPPMARRAQIERLLSGEVDIVVCTDVIGHGINLPIDAVALAETQKYDGVQRRRLHLWETAQILGRAGRFGHSDVGHVYVPQGLPWMSSKVGLVQRGTRAATGEESTGWKLSQANLRPTLEELGATTGEEILYRLPLWKNMMASAVDRYPVTVTAVGSIIENVNRIVRANNNLGALLEADRIWRLATCPVDDPNIIMAGAEALTGNMSPLRTLVRSATLKGNVSLENAETIASNARNLRALISATGTVEEVSYSFVQKLEEDASVAVTKALKKLKTKYGICQDCGSACMPWFERCDSCHQQAYMNRRGWRYDYYDDDYF